MFLEHLEYKFKFLIFSATNCISLMVVTNVNVFRFYLMIKLTDGLSVGLSSVKCKH